MKLSEFELMILTALAKGDPEEKNIRLQLEDARVKKRDYTGVGLFTEILVEIKPGHRLCQSNRHIERTPMAHMQHPALTDGASAYLWFNDGFVHTLEGLTCDGEDWPQNEGLFTITVPGYRLLDE